MPPRQAVYGTILDGDSVVDDVIVTVFKAPYSYTGEDVAEIACHGSVYIQRRLLQLIIGAGARAAEPGEFTRRAFLNGKLDLSQAEAVADLIASNSRVSHEIAMRQMRGGFSAKIRELRQQLVDFASLIELELDFSEEDVEFAERPRLLELVENIMKAIALLIESFEVGNVLKNGVPVAIVGKPNAGKSTLLNVLLEEERAIVSDIPGTTRDVIEDELVIEGVLFRLLDTAGLRQSEDSVEQMGVQRSYEVMKKAAIVIYLFDAHEYGEADVRSELDEVRKYIGTGDLVVVGNKIDREDLPALRSKFSDLPGTIFMSARERTNIEELRQRLLFCFESKAEGMGDTIVTSARHAESLKRANEALLRVKKGLTSKLSGELLAAEIRFALQELGQITGQVSSEDLLSNIFSRFCIGK